MNYEADFAIITIVPEAWQVTFSVFGDPTRWESRAGQNWPLWEMPVADGGRARVVATKAQDRSNLPAHQIATTTLMAWRPRHLLLADIGGGFTDRDDLCIGDLVVASEIEYYSLVKETEDGDETRGLPLIPPSPMPRGAFEDLTQRAPGWTAGIPVRRPEFIENQQPKILPGQIVCGERLLANPASPTVKALATRYEKALAVDMESAGASRAVLAAQQTPIFTRFGVIRGISDFIDDANRDNQETRDAAKPYAAAVALTATHACIYNEPSDESVLNQAEAATAKRPEVVGDAQAYREELRRLLSGVPPAGGTSFRLTLQSTKAKIEATALGDDEIERGEVLDLVMHDKLVAIVGASGTGKSVLLDTIARQLASEEDPLVVRIDLKSGWSEALAPGLEEKPFGDRLAPSMEALLSASSPAMTVERLGRLAETHTVLILLDALNEVPPEAAKKIRLTLGQYARLHQNVRILATDRSVDRDYRELHWTALRLPELDPADAGHVFDAEFVEGEFDRQPAMRKEILRIPFFLDRAIRDKTINFTSRADAVEQFLIDGGLDSDDLDVVGEIALSVLMQGKATLSESDEQSLENNEVLETLKGGGFLTGGTMGLVFSHQLIHQCLAGRQLATKPELWTPETMDSLTSFAASLDGIGMTISAIEDDHERDRFLRIVYDWNWTASVVALSEAQAGNRTVSDAMEQAILAMIAEKRFDPVQGTRIRVNDLLTKVGCETADLLGACTSEELYEYINSQEHPDTEWWEEWKKMFLCFDPAELLDERTVARLASEMPLIGWMVSNSLRRIDSSSEVSGLVRAIYRSHSLTSANSRTIRWRAVHTLGAWPSRKNAELLVEALGDEHMWCSYGATRSTVEMAARTSDLELRTWILDRLSEVWPQLEAEPLSQLAWASRYRDADPGWPAAIRPVIVAVRDAQTEEERDRWDRRLDGFDRYAAEIAEQSRIPARSWRRRRRR